MITCINENVKQYIDFFKLQRWVDVKLRDIRTRQIRNRIEVEAYTSHVRKLKENLEELIEKQGKNGKHVRLIKHKLTESKDKLS